MSGIFIQEDETIEAKIFIGYSEDKKSIFANKDKTLLLKEENIVEKSIVEHSVVLKKPSYKEEVAVMSKALKTNINADTVQLDFVAMNYTRLITLLIGWSFVNDDNSPIVVNETSINKLHPSIANAIINIISDYV